MQSEHRDVRYAPNATRTSRSVRGTAHSTFSHTIVVPDLARITNSVVMAKDLGGTFGVEVKHNLLDPWTQRLKRVLDIGAAAVGGVLILPLILMLSMLVWMESGGPIFYRDQRLGRDGTLFSRLKFRTMSGP